MRNTDTMSEALRVESTTSIVAGPSRSWAQSPRFLLHAKAATASFRMWIQHLFPLSSRERLVEPLTEVANAVSSPMDIDQLLTVLVDEAKILARTDKAVLCLVVEDEEGVHPDRESLVVRGRRDEYPEDWWLQKVEEMADRVFASGEAEKQFDKAVGAWLMCVPIAMKGTPIGILATINSAGRGFTSDQEAFLRVLAAFAASSLENSRLSMEAKMSLLASERTRISREMHDGLSQKLFSISLGLEACRRMLERSPSEAAVRLEELQQHLANSQVELRHYIYDLRPVSLERLGLFGALEYVVAEITDGYRLRGRLVEDGEAQSLSPSIEACLFRVGQEAMSNVARHSRARYFRVALSFEDSTARLVVEDNGVGFDAEEALERSTHGDTMGLASMRRRVEDEGGSFGVSSKLGSGTSVWACLPI